MVSWTKAKQTKMRRAYLKRRTSTSKVNKEGFGVLYGGSGRVGFDPWLDTKYPGKTDQIREPLLEVAEHLFELRQSDRHQNLTVFKHINLHANTHDRVDLYFSGSQYFFEHRNYFRKVIRRSRIYTDREYAMKRYLRDPQGGSRIDWKSTTPFEEDVK